jgi:hypothetical protein
MWNDLNRQETIIVVMLVVNEGIGLCYLLWCTVLRGFINQFRRNKKPLNTLTHVFRAFVILLAPMVGIAFFVCGVILRKIFFRREVDLSAVIFSKEHVETQMKADEERGRNLAPIEEALAVSDKDSLRVLMMNVIRGDIKKSLAAISLGLNSEDSETAHYAASVLRDELNGFRMQVQRIYQDIINEDENQLTLCVMLIEYMNGVLEQKVFSHLEQKTLVLQMEKVADILFQKDPTQLESRHFEWLCLRLMEASEFEAMFKWCQLQMQQYPEELASYVCMLKYYYSVMNRVQIFEVLEQLKKSNIVLDNATLDLIRLFG